MSRRSPSTLFSLLLAFSLTATGQPSRLALYTLPNELPPT